jgi:uncharacterized membrane protein
MTDFTSGAIAMASWVAGLFFLRFWRRTHDRFFGFFALAFWMMGLQRLVLTLLPHADEHLAAVYLLRLAGFVLILVAILDKNRARRGPRPG